MTTQPSGLPDRRILALAALLGVLAAFALGALGHAVRRGQLIAGDVVIGAAIRTHSPLSLNPLARSLGRLGEAPLWDALVLAAVIGLALTKRRTAALTLLVGVLCAELGTTIVKAWASGPQATLGETIHFLPVDGFPSGHVVRVLVTLGLFILLAWPTPSRPLAFAIGSVGAILLVLLMAWARIITRSHTPSEVVGAILLGALILDVIYLTQLLLARPVRIASFRPARRPRHSPVRIGG
jgi:membrane-associated phospholipid phosphatase